MGLAQNQWLEETATLADLRTRWGDCLDVIEGRLQLEKCNYYFSSWQIIIPNPSAVADHLENLITHTAQAHFQSLQSSHRDSPQFYEQIAGFKRQFTYLYTRISDLQYMLRTHANKSHAERYSQLFELASTFLKQVKDYKSTLRKPSLAEYPIKHIDYNERTELRTIKWSYPKRVPLSDTVAAAKKALLLAQPKPQPFYIKYIQTIGNAVPFLCLGLLTALKIVLWNPLEWLIRGEVRSLSPLRLVLEALRNNNRHMEAYQQFTTQLLHQPVITEEVAEAFKQLAPQANLLDLHGAILATKDITELAPFMAEDTRPGAIPLVTYLNTMKRICERKNIELLSLGSVSHLYKLHNDVYLRTPHNNQSIEDFLDEVSNRLGQKGDICPAHAVNPYISPRALQQLLDAASSSSTCREITLSTSLLKLQSVHNFLKQYSYRLKEGNEHQKTYRKYSLI